ncbi:MAG: SEC-C metal-binding domain-containing protein, partial [Actinomycetota bacterium]|nr:SEC-C metal-binding domain-containing protein [Actinomycetota bacterium]
AARTSRPPSVSGAPAVPGRAGAALAGAASVGERGARKLGRNDPCWCGSGMKFKLCHGKS